VAIKPAIHSINEPAELDKNVAKGTAMLSVLMEFMKISEEVFEAANQRGTAKRSAYPAVVSAR